jgi:Galactose mutarotase and related enzymes
MMNMVKYCNIKSVINWEVNNLYHVLKNDFLTIRIEELGAELISIINNHTQKEYLWNADSKYWKRHSPILFPFVGSLKDKSYLYQGRTYPALQHGFARDMTFNLFKATDEELWFSLEADETTLDIYPFLFRLEIGYLLSGNKISVAWHVLNKGENELFFSIGAHPAFLCPLDPEETQSDCFLSFDTESPLCYHHINENGLLIKKADGTENYISTDFGVLPVDSHMFDLDALIFEDHQCHRISLLDSTRMPYVTVTFDAPLFGLWSPAGKNAPFICIEPWYGRCDSEDYNGSLQERECGNTLLPGKVFEASYCVEIN